MMRSVTWRRSPNFSRSTPKPFAARIIRRYCGCAPILAKKLRDRGYLNGFLRILQQENAMNTERTPLNDKELWRSLAAARDDAPEVVSDLDFAAWLEGRLPETAAARIDAAVAADPEMRRAALELADILGKPLPAPPARLEVRAKALAGFEAEQEARRVGLFDWLFASD